MGFRNPIASAQAVDTGRGLADPGVRIYEDTSVPAVPQGVVEWRTGLMTTNATARLSGGGSGGSAFAIAGGATEGVSAPEIDLNIEGLPAGGYGPKARISVPWELVVASTELTPVSPYFTQFEATETNYYHARYAKGADGFVTVWGRVKVVNTGFGVGQAVAGLLPAGCRPRMNMVFILNGWTLNGAWTALIDPAGHICWEGNVAGASTLNGWLSLDGLHFLAEQ